MAAIPWSRIVPEQILPYVIGSPVGDRGGDIGIRYFVMEIEASRIGDSPFHAFFSVVALIDPRSQKKHDTTVFRSDAIYRTTAWLDLHICRAPAKPACRRWITKANQFHPEGFFWKRSHDLRRNWYRTILRMLVDCIKYIFDICNNIGRLNACIRRYNEHRLTCPWSKFENQGVHELKYYGGILTTRICDNPRPRIPVIEGAQVRNNLCFGIFRKSGLDG